LRRPGPTGYNGPVPSPLAVTFDAGQTLVELDTAMLARRLGERGWTVAAAALDAAAPAAWARYDQGVAAGADRPWCVFMDALLAAAAAGGGDPAARAAIVEWLWDEQPRVNLWRRPVAGMIELVGALRAAGVPVGVVSNSEGALAELFDEIGWAGRFDAIADSMRVGIEKPDPRIFAWVAARLGVDPAAIVHVGDSHPADVGGALAAGARAIWFGRAAVATDDPRVAVAHDAGEVRAALRAMGAPLA